jgi:hypothetical protein
LASILLTIIAALAVVIERGLDTAARSQAP